MYVMRIGAPGAEKPAARVDDAGYDVADDFDEEFSGSGGIERIASLVVAGTPAPFAGERIFTKSPDTLIGPNDAVRGIPGLGSQRQNVVAPR